MNLRFLIKTINQAKKLKKKLFCNLKTSKKVREEIKAYY